MTEKDLTGLEDLSGLFMYARGEIRTRNRRIRSPALYPLSYSGIKWKWLAAVISHSTH